ncbi:MAG TPA: hypothetical protein VFZ11_00485 [Gemmatimonadaceae bacterium]
MTPRPIFLTIVAVLLGWLAVVALGNAVVLVQRADDARSIGFRPEILVPLALAYAASAALAAVGLWRMSRWAPWALLGWGVVAAAVGASVALGAGPSGVSRWALAGPALFLGIVVAPLVRWVRRRTSAAEAGHR